MKLTILVVTAWFLVSIPAALVIGRFLSTREGK